MVKRIDDSLISIDRFCFWWPLRFSIGASLIYGISACLLPTLGAFADESGTASFDASEFKSTSFNDVDKAKKNFSEISVVHNGAHNRGKKSVLKSNVISHEKDQSKIVNERTLFENASENAPIHELAGDWVPSHIDLTANGAFGIAPFNGAPVPYELNGHVDVERGKP